MSAIADFFEYFWIPLAFCAVVGFLVIIGPVIWEEWRHRNDYED